MSENRIFKVDITEFESASLFTGNQVPCNLIYSPAFTSIHDTDTLQKIKHFLDTKSVRINLVELDKIDIDKPALLDKNSALNIFILDGFNPKSAFIYGALHNSKTPSIAIATSSNKTFFEKLNQFPDILSEKDSDFVKENEVFLLNMKAVAQDFLNNNLNIHEHEISNFDDNKDQFFELVNSSIAKSDIDQKLLEDLKAQSEQLEVSAITSLINKVDIRDDITVQNFELALKEYEGLEKGNRSRLSGVNHIAISFLLQRLSDVESSNNCEYLSMLKGFTENAIDVDSDTEVSIENLKNLADSCLLCDENENNFATKASFFYDKALELLQSEDGSSIVFDIKNNIAVSFIKIGEYEKSIDCLKQIVALPSIEKNPFKFANMTYNLGISYLYKANEDEDIENYKKAVECLSSSKSAFEQIGESYDQLGLSINLSHALGSTAKISNDVELINSSIESYKTTLELLNNNKNDERYANVLLGLGESHLLLSSFENNVENNIKAAEMFDESLKLIDENKNGEQCLNIKTKMGNAYLNVSLEEGHTDKIKDAIRSYEDALRFVDPKQQIEDYGVLNRKLGDSYKVEGEFERNVESFLRAIDSYDQSLSFFSLESNSQDFAEIKRNIGATFEMLSQLEYESSYCAKSIDAYNEALEVFNKNDFPEKYYSTVNNLGNAYSALSEFENKKDNCNKAIECYKVASEYITFDRSPLDYAMTQNNIGVAYTTLAGEVDNKTYLENSINAFKESLKVYSLNEHPDNYAMIQNNLGDSYLEIAFFDDNPDLIKKAISSFEESRKVFEGESNPSKYGFITRKIARSYKELFSYDNNPENLHSSIKANLESLNYFKHEFLPEEYSLIQIELGSLFSNDLKDGLNVSNLYKAMEAYKNASRYFNADVYPIQYAKISNNLGNLYRKLSFIENKKENALEAVRYLSSAADYIESKSHETDHAQILNNLGASYSLLSEVMEPESNLYKAREIFNNALNLVPEDNIALISSIKNNIANTNCSLYEINSDSSQLDFVLEDYSKAIENMDSQGSSVGFSVSKNNYSNAKLLICEKDNSHSNEDISLVFGNYEEALNNISSEEHPGIYASIKNNNACCNLFLFSHREKDSYIEASISDLENAEQILSGYGTDYLETTLKNNKSVSLLYSSTFSSDMDQCENVIELLKPITEINDENSDKISELSKLKANINLANAYRLYHRKTNDKDSAEALVNIYKKSLNNFDVEKNPLIYASTNFHIAMICKEIFEISKDATLYSDCLEHLDKSLHGFKDDKFLYERGIVHYEIGLINNALFNDENNAEYLNNSITHLEKAHDIFSSEDFPNKNSHIKFLLAKSKFELGRINNDVSVIFDSIENYEHISNFFNEKDFPNEFKEIGEKLNVAYELLLAEDKDFEDSLKGIEYYSKLLDIFKTKNIELDISGIQINLGNLYLKSYDEASNSESLEKAKEAYSNAIKLIDKNSETEKFYKTLLSAADIDGKLGDILNDSNLLKEKISKIEDCINFFSKEKDGTTYINLNCDIADTYSTLYKITGDESQLFDSNHYYKQALSVAEQSSKEYGEIKEIYLNNKQKLVDTYSESNNYNKVIDLIEKDIDFIESDSDTKSSASSFLTLGNAYKKLSGNEYSKDNLLRSVDNLCKALEFFNKTDYPQNYFSIQKDLFENSKTLLENESDKKYLNDSISTLSAVIDYCNENNLEEDSKKFQLEKAELLFSSAKNEFDNSNTKQAILLCQQSLEFYKIEDHPEKYASIQKLMGICYLQNEDSENLVNNLQNSINCFSEAKNVFNNNEFSSDLDLSEINSSLEKVYEKLIEEDGHYDNEKKIDYLNNLIALYKENERYEALPSAYKDIAETYSSLGETKNDKDFFKDSIKNFKNYMSYLDENSHIDELASTQKMLGNLCFEIYCLSEEKENLSDSIEHYEKAKELYTIYEDEDQVSELSNKLFDSYRQYGKFYENKNELDTALFFYEKATEVVSEKETEFYEQKLKNANLYTKLAESNNDYETYNKAIDSFQVCLANFIDNKEKAKAHIQLGETFEKIFNLNNDISKLEESIISYKNSLNYISDDENLKENVNDKIARLTIQSADSLFKESGELSEDKYIDSLQYYTLEKNPEKYAEINIKLANNSKEKFEKSKNKEDAEMALNYFNSSLKVYEKDKFPQQTYDAGKNIKSIYELLLENDSLSSDEKYSYIYKLKEIALKTENSNDLAKYNLVLAQNYFNEQLSNLNENDFEEFMSSLKASEIFVGSESPENSAEFQYSIAKLYNTKAKNTNNKDYYTESINFFDKFANNSNLSADDSRLNEVEKIINESILEKASSYRESGEIGLSIESYLSALGGLNEHEEPEKYYDISLILGDLYFDFYNKENSIAHLDKSLDFYSKAETHFADKENSAQILHIKDKFDRIFELKVDYANSLDNIDERISNFDELISNYTDDGSPSKHFQLQKLKGFNLIQLYDLSKNIDDLYNAEKLLNKVLHLVEDHGSERDMAEINLNFGHINYSFYIANDERVKLDYAHALYQNAISFYEKDGDNENISKIQLKINEIEEILTVLDSTESVEDEIAAKDELEAAKEEKFDEASEVTFPENIETEEISNFDENEDNKEDVLELVNEIIEEPSTLKMTEDSSDDIEKAEILTEETISEIDKIDQVYKATVGEKTESENVVAKKEEVVEEFFASHSEEDDSSVTSMTEDYKSQLEKINKKESPHEFAKMSAQLAQSFANDAANGKDFSGYGSAIKNYQNAINAIDEKDFPQLYYEICRDMISIYPQITKEIDLRDYKNMLGIGERVLNYFNEKDFSQDYAVINKNIGIVNTALAEREGQLKYYKDSIPYYDNALKFINKDNLSDDYAIINMNLGIAYGVISEIEFDNKAFVNSIKSYERSLDSLDESKSPDEYALVNKYLGIAYGTYGERNNDSGYLEKSVVCYENALRHFSVDDDSNDYGLINRNLGNNYLKLIETNNDPEFCKKGIVAYEKALEFYKVEKTPFVYASIYNNIGSIYSALSDIENKVENCEKAIDSYSKVLKVYNLNDNPMEFAAANNNLGIAHRNLAEVANKVENSTKAINYYEKSLKAYTLKDFPIQYSNTQNNLGTAYRTLAEEENKIDNCKKAISSYKEALKVRTFENMPIQFAATQNNLGVAYRTLSEVESKSKNCKKAISAYESALIVYSFEKFPIQYATTRNNLAGAYSTLAESEDKKQNYSNSIQSYREAQKVFSQNQFPDIYNMIEENIIYLQDNVDQ